MADFLTRLAARALGTVPVAQPIIAPLFAPGAAVSGPWQPDGTEDEAAARPSSESMGRLPTSPTSGQDRPLAPTLLPERGTPLQGDGPELEQATRDEGETSAPATQVRRRELPAAVIAHTVETAVRTSAENLEWEEQESLGSTIQAAPRPPASLPGIIHPQVSGYRAPPQLATSAGQAAPSTVQVTIGRIEVRALLPAQAPAPRTRSTSPGQALPLHEYLKQRERGQR